MVKHPKFVNRDVSWLSFNQRVLQEAEDKTVPILERLRFLAIFSNNLDEFFRVRIATLKRVMDFGKTAKTTLRIKPHKLLDEIQKIVIQQNLKFEKIYKEIQQELRSHGIYITDEKKLNASQSAFVKSYFDNKVRPSLVPIMLSQVKRFPYLKDKSIYLAVKLSTKGQPRLTQYALLEIPSDPEGRFVILPSTNHNHYVMLLDDIIRYNLPSVFSVFPFDKIESYTIKLTRDAELDIDNDVSQSFLDKISKSVKNRQKGDPVRFVYDQSMPADMLAIFTSRMKLRKYDNLIPGFRYHNFKDFMSFPALGPKSLRYEDPKPIVHPALAKEKSMFDAIRKQDILLHFPYQSFNHFIELLREAAIDPTVKSIKITLYRAAKKSKVINALINAARNGKDVTVVVELQARFDEEANIKWAKALAEENIRVIYGVQGLKVHSKLCLIQREEKGKQKLYANISTGNYNEVTSNVYCDESLLTAEPHITSEVAHVFDFFDRNYIVRQYKYLIPSPLRTRKKFMHLIDEEIYYAKHKKKSGIFIKMNSLVDEEMITKLYDASNNGVKIKIIVRGTCALIPGVPGMSENIEVISIVDRYLEHSRIFIFENGGEPLYYISSADWMTRNLDSRIEISTPILDKNLQQELLDILNIQWSDNVKSRVINAAQDNIYRHTGSAIRVRSQDKIYQYLKKK
ncbi:MAG: polyphosphate kinase 1 [Bacteroidetes bacterium]|nr:polyphosphate kinase 1 [Bacteroidota bacterium]